MASIDEFDDQTKKTMADSTPKPNFADQRKEISARYQKLIADSRVRTGAVRGASGGVQGASSLNDDPEVRRAVTSQRSLARDYRLARREAIRRNNRLGALAISERARNAGINIHGISRHGDDTRAAAVAIQAQRAVNAFDQRSMMELAEESRGVNTQTGSSGATTTTTNTGPKDTKPQQVVQPDPFDQVGSIDGRNAGEVLGEIRKKQNTETGLANTALRLGVNASLPFGIRLAPSFNPFTNI